MAFLTYVTDAGLQKIAEQIASGRNWIFTSVQFSSGFAVADEKRTALSSVEERFPLAQVSRSGATIVRVEGQPTSSKNYLIKEVGIFIADATTFAENGIDSAAVRQGEVLLAIQSNNDGLGTAIAGQKNIFSYDLELGQKPLERIQITGPGNNLNLFVGEELTELTTVITTLTERILQLEQRLVRLERR